MTFLIASRRWDDAFSLVVVHEPAARRLPQLFRAALEDLLRLGRGSTLELWVRKAHRLGVKAPVVDLAEAEVSLRRGRHHQAHALAASAVRQKDLPRPLLLRGLLVAGRSAHLTDRFELALSLYGDAQALAVSRRERFDALWGQFIAAAFLESAVTYRIFESLTQLGDVSPDATLLLAIAKFNVACLRNTEVSGALDGFKAAEHLAAHADDALVRANFWQTYAHASVLVGEYQRALGLLEHADDVIARHDVLFAAPVARAVAAFAQFGLGQYRSAAQTAASVEREATTLADEHTLSNARVVKARVLLAAGDYSEALRVLPPPSRRLTVGPLAGEIHATRAVAYACCEEIEASERELRRATAITRSLEASGLGLWAEAVRAASSSEASASGALEAAVAHAQMTGYVDAPAFAMKVWPRLLGGLTALAAGEGPLSIAASRLRSLSAVATEVQSPDQLSPREREVGALVAAGLKNREIAQTLVISEATVKVHVRHILEKLHVRSRAEAVPRLLMR
jgi:DNA-binding NarL/FixJ family response regulator